MIGPDYKWVESGPYAEPRSEPQSGRVSGAEASGGVSSDRDTKGSGSTHPPIPPKSEFFRWSEEDGEWDFMLRTCYGGDAMCIGLEGKGSMIDVWDVNTYGALKPHVAAVAEVEWRKRAERWEEVRKANVWTGFERFALACEGMRLALENAAAWRAWGESK